MRSFSNARVATPEGIKGGVSVLLQGERIVEVAGGGRGGIDLGGLLLLPGMVDLHGDAFERQLMPRPGVHFPAPAALLDTDRQLLANGITTAYHGLTLSWEPGLRGIAAARALLDALEEVKPQLGCNTRLHLRFEVFNLDCVDEVLWWMASGRIDLLAFNEHTKDIAKTLERGRIASYLDRSGLDEAAFRRLFAKVLSRASEVHGRMQSLAATARAAGVALASHDDESPSERAMHRALGCRITEFPLDLATAEAAQAAGDCIVMGAPNVVRGGSHAARLGAADAAARGLCAVLTSDYYYPALLQAPFRLARDGVMPLDRAWALVSRNPAAAVGLEDRGSLEPGGRADLVLVDDAEPGLPVVAATIVGGQVVFVDGSRVPGLLQPARQTAAEAAD